MKTPIRHNRCTYQEVGPPPAVCGAVMELRPRRASPLGAVELSSRSDEYLLELVAARRDEAAFAEFYGRYGKAVYAVVLRVIGDRAYTEDVVQHAFTSVWRAAAGYRRER